MGNCAHFQTVCIGQQRPLEIKSRKGEEAIMNKIYKVIWSKAKNCYVVVSEIAKRNGKCKAAKTDSLTDSLNRRKRLADLLSIHTPALTKAVMALLLAGMIAMPNVAGAGTAYQNNTPVGNASAGGGNNASAYGNNANASGSNSTAIGGGSQATGAGTIAVGQGAKATKASDSDPEPTGAIAVGYGSAANADNSVVVGRKAKASGEAAIAVGFSATAGMTQNDAQGTAYSELNQTIKNDSAFQGITDVTNANDYASLVSALETLVTSGTDPQKAAATNYLNQLNARVTVLMSKNAIAVGNEAKALAQDSIAVGRSAQATGQDSIAVGRSAQATGQDSIAVGRSATARGAYSVSIGQGARNRTAYGIAIGVTAGVSRAGGTTLPDAGGLTEGTGAIAIGYGASNFTYGTFQADDSYENVKNTVAIGTKVHTHAQYAVAIGAYTDATAERSFALGTSSTNNTDAHKGSRAGGQGSVVIGDQAEAFSDYYYEDQFIGLVDPGRATDTNANDAIAVGTQARVMAKNAVAMGGNISYTGLANDPYGVTRFTTIYGKTNAGGETGAIVGEGADAGIAIGGAYGTIDKDKGITIISEAAATYGMRGIAIGSGALVANLSDYDSIADIINSSDYITAKTNYEMALSAYTNALNDYSNKTATYESLKSAFDTNYPTEPAEGDDLRQQYLLDKAELEAAESAMTTAKTAVNTAQGNLDAPLVAYEAQRIKIDKLEADDAIKVEDAVAIGANAKAGIARSIAMGSDSVTKDSDEAGLVTGVIGYDMGTGQPYAKDGRYSPTWMSTAGAFSVGGGISDTGQIVTRRITNVAAGANDTDAVNVAQLKVAMDSTIMSSDNRNVGVGAAKERGLEIFSPYYHVTGIKDAAEASSFINKYETQADYEDQLNNELTTLKGHKTRIETSIGQLNDKLTEKNNKKTALEIAYGSEENALQHDDYNEVLAEITHLTSELSIQNTELTQKQTEIANKEDEIADAGTTWTKNNNLYETRAMASGTNATAIGYKANANGDNTIAFGEEANAGAENAIALGTGAAVTESGTRSISIGNKTGKVNGKDVTGNAVTGTDSISLGNGNAVSGNNSVGVGTGLTLTGKKSIGIGSEHKVYGEESGTMGDPNVLAANYSYVIGNTNSIGNTEYKNGDTITTENIFIMGNYNVIPERQQHVYVLGSDTIATASRSVILGDRSGYVEKDYKSNDIETAGTTAGSDGYNKMVVNGKEYKFAGGDSEGVDVPKTVVGVVSVGYRDPSGKEVFNTRRIQNVAPGLISAESTDAINGSQLYQAIKALTIDVVAADDKSAKVEKSTSNTGDSTGGGGTGSTATTTYTISAGQTTIQKTDKDTSMSGNLTIKDELETKETDPKSYDYKIDLAKDITVDSVKAGDTTINNNGLTIKDGPSMTKEGFKYGDSTLNDTGLTVGDTTVNNNGLTIKDGDKNGPSVTKDGIDAADKKITNVADGDISETSTDAVNGRQLYEVKNSGLTFNGDSGTTGVVKLGEKLDINGDNNITTAAETGKLNIKLNKDLTVDSLKAGDTTINNDGLTVGDTAITKDKVSSTTFVAGDTTINNSGVTIQNGPSMKAADGFKYGNSTLNDTGLTVGNTTVQDNKIAIDGGPSMTKEGVNAGGQKITNVANGDVSANSTDAVNGGQLYSAIDNVNHDISNVDNRARKGIAGAAALAALHPMEFDPDDKLTFAAGMGHYRGETAAALGMFYRPDEKVMFSLGGTVGNGENMVNAGVSFSLDRTPRVTGSRTALTKEVVHLREQVAKQDARIAKQDAQIAHLTALVSQLTGTKVDFPDELQANASGMFPDNLDNKWAYDKLEELEQQGYIKGFAGRTLSRDEFAAALDTAMARGAKLDERLVKEFEPELSHVRIAHVEGKGNEEGNWYERPRFSHDKAEKNGIAKKQYRIQPKK